jgi:hypothetical protein
VFFVIKKIKMKDMVILYRDMECHVITTAIKINNVDGKSYHISFNGDRCMMTRDYSEAIKLCEKYLMSPKRQNPYLG